MYFSDKLSFLIDILNVKSLDIANNIYIDKTLISKWRNGQRKPRNNSENMKKLCEYFAKQFCKSENVAHIKATFLPEASFTFQDYDKLLAALYDWFNDDDKSFSDFVYSLSNINMPLDEINIDKINNISSHFHAGMEGYIEAGNILIDYIPKDVPPKTIKVFSDFRLFGYSLDYIHENNLDFNFFDLALENGHYIKMLHNIAIDNLPFYLSFFNEKIPDKAKDRFSFNYISINTPAPYYFTIIDDEVVRYGPFSTDHDAYPLLSHITTDKNTIKVFENIFNKLYNDSVYVDLSKYSFI